MSKQKPKSKEKSYEEIGQMMVNIYESGYLDKNRMYKMSFLKGLVSGLGGVLGATIIVALLIWLLTLFGHISILRPLTDNVRDTIESQR